MFRFSIRELMLVTLVAALVVQLWRDRTRIQFLEWKQAEVITVSGPVSQQSLQKAISEDRKLKERFAGQPPKLAPEQKGDRFITVIRSAANP